MTRTNKLTPQQQMSDAHVEDENVAQATVP